MTKKIFVTATGTDVGKTYISALIIKKIREAGINCGYYKPVLSGVESCCGKLTASDVNYVVKTANIPCSPDSCVSYWWEEAVSPHLAAERAGIEINIKKILSDYKEACREYEYLLIEGAGGITCPLKLNNGEKYLLKDLIKDFGVNILIVADAGLGTINSILLTVEYARMNKISIDGIILNNYEQENFMHRDNLKQIEYLTGIEVISTVVRNGVDIELPERFLEN
ncbi:MAG: dethiobiotin synthase [Candidatus Gastranaerophilales bacterium]|nr:dethiobiotin synthase [Candidatus Gastranaerophilales bacterium]